MAVIKNKKNYSFKRKFYSFKYKNKVFFSNACCFNLYSGETHTVFNFLNKQKLLPYFFIFNDLLFKQYIFKINSVNYIFKNILFFQTWAIWDNFFYIFYTDRFINYKDYMSIGNKKNIKFFSYIDFNKF